MQSEAAVFEGRLHPLTLAFAAYTAVRRLILPAIPLLVFSDRRLGPAILGVLFVSALAQALGRYFSFRYRVEGGELVVRQGILERRERHIPLERVQEIRIEQGVLHRLLGVVDAQVDTGGGGGPEATLSVLSRAEAERLQLAVGERVAKVGEAAASPNEAVVVRRLGVGELALSGLTSNHLVSALALAGLLWTLLDDFVSEGALRRGAGAVFGTTRRVYEQDVWSTVALTVLGGALLLLLAVTFSVAGAIVLYYGFTLTLRGDDLGRRYGLLTRRASSLPRRRIQVLEVEEGLLRRFCRLATLRADTVAGRTDGDEPKDQWRGVLLPIVPRAEVEELLPVFLPDLEPGPAEWRQVSRLSVRRGTVKGAAVCALAASASAALQHSAYGLWPLFMLAPLYWVNLRRYRHLGYALGERYFRTRRGWLSRSTHLVPIRKVQEVEVRQNWFDRRLGLATLVVDTAGQAYTGGGPLVTNLPLEEARRLAATLARRAQRGMAHG